jgi:sporulation protein YlmC with PRC-barrel domain
MKRIVAPALCALSAVALGACSQQNADFMPGGGASGAAASAPAAPSTPATPLPTAAQRASTLIGLPVRSRSGERLGAVADIVFSGEGRASHLIVVLSGAGGASGTLIPIPWEVAIKHVHGGALVLKSRELTAAPGFTPDDWPRLDAQGWSAAADAYWSRVGEAPFVPVDPTTRSRERSSMNL